MNARMLFVLSTLVVSLPCAAVAVADEPTGFDKAKFGASAEDVGKLYPSMEALNEEQLGAAVIQGPLITRYVLRKQAVPGLEKPTDVELRFWRNKLWLVIVYYGDNSEEAVLGALEKQLGVDEGASAAQAVWTGEKADVVVEKKQRWYGMNDRELSKEAQKWFVEAIKGNINYDPAADSTPAAPATPAAGAVAPTAGAKPQEPAAK